MVSMTLLSSTVVVSGVATGETEADAMVGGTNTGPPQGVVGAVATLILSLRVLQMLPPVGMEALIVAVMGADRVSMLCGVGLVTTLTPAGTPNVPSAGHE